MNTHKSADADFAGPSMRGIEILRPVAYTYAVFLLLLLVAYISGCADFNVTSDRWTDHYKAQQEVVSRITEMEAKKVKAILAWAKTQPPATQGLVLGMLISDRSVEDMARVVGAVDRPDPTTGEIWAKGIGSSLVPLASIGFGTWLGITSINGMRDVAAGVSAGSVVSNYNRSNNSSTGAQNIDTGNTYNLNQPDPTTATATGTVTYDFRAVEEPAR